MSREKSAHGEGRLKCPFLTAVDALTCQLSTVKKFVPNNAVVEAEQRCTSANWRACPLVPPDALAGVENAVCPYLQRVRMQRCSAAPVGRLIPGGDHLPSRCAGPSHRYCSSYVERTDPHPSLRATVMAALPPRLAVAPNHMWLDVHADGTCHVGVDAFLVRVVGAVEKVMLPSVRGPARPSVVLTVPVGRELPLVFPHVIDVEATNVALRKRPDALVEDPYRGGWLYEGRVRGGEPPSGKLLRGAPAKAWLGTEVERLTVLVHEMIAHRGDDLGPTLADGGLFDEGLAQQLDHAELLQVFAAFFAG